MRRLILSGWAVCLLLGMGSASVKILPGSYTVAPWQIGAATITSLIVALALRRGMAGLMAGLGMGASGLASGIGIGMVCLGFATHRSLPYFLAMKWIAVGFLLTLIFRSLIRDLEAPSEEFPEVDWDLVKATSQEEVEARLAKLPEYERSQEEARIDEEREMVRTQLTNLTEHLKKVKAETRRDLLQGFSILLIGIAVLMSSFNLSSLAKW